MSDLNLDFDLGTKVVSIGDNNHVDNLGFTKEISIDNDLKLNPDTISPNLNVDSVDLLTNIESNPLNNLSDNKDSNLKKKEEKEEFSFFKVDETSEKKSEIDISNDNIILNNESKSDIYKPIHRLTPQEIKNEK